MLTRELKLKLNKSQISELERWLLTLQSVYNFGIRKIELNAKNKIYFSKFDFQNLLTGHSKKLHIPSHVIQGILCRAYAAWQNCFQKRTRKPRLKGVSRPIRYIPFPDPIKPPRDGVIGFLGLGKVRYFKQQLPDGKIKCGRIIKRASGWYLQLFIEAKHVFPVKANAPVVGIDTGFKSLLSLSDGTTYENPRELRRGSERLAQVQRGNDKNLTARLHERQSNRRKDRNHKISREIVENYSAIYITYDNLKGQAKKFGKSITESSIGTLRNYLRYKGHNAGREYVEVPSFKTTMTCSNCWNQTGPTGLNKLAVRVWECACGVLHDRDVNSARVILKLGLGCSLESTKYVRNGINDQYQSSS